MKEMSAFMATAHAKFTGEVGLCYAISGPGAIFSLTSGNVMAALGDTPVSAATVGALNGAAEANVGAQGIACGRTVNLSTGSWKLISISKGSIAAATFVPSTSKGLLEG
jgi:hypothetical protein